MKRSRSIFHFYMFIMPWIVGFLLFTLYPIVASLYYSLTSYNVVDSPRFVGLANYIAMFKDPIFWYSVKATLYYTLLSVPLGLILSLLFAMLLNQNHVGKGFFRTVMYLPSMISGVAMSMLWMWIFNPQIGLANYLLSRVGIQGPMWLLDSKWAVPALIIMSLWTTGNGMIIFLASIQGVPASLIEASILDGAGWWSRFWHVTMPMISPIFLFELIMGVINSFQVFTQAFVMTQGGPHYATTFYVYYIYQNAFQNFNMGYASALSWLLFVTVMALTFLIMKVSDRYVYYEGGENK